MCLSVRRDPVPEESALSPTPGGAVRRPRGSTEAQEALHVRFFDTLVRYCGTIGAGADSEDVAQEALLRAHKNLATTFEQDRPTWPWLKTIAANLRTDWARRRSREEPLDPKVHDAPVGGGEHRIEERAVLDEAMARLAPTQRTALFLRYEEDWDTANAAGLVGVSVPAFKQLLFRARERLRAEVRRITEGALGWVHLRPFRRWISVRGARAQRRGGRLAPYAGLASESGNQLAAGIIALAIGLGGSPLPAHPSDDVRPLSAALEVPPSHAAPAEAQGTPTAAPPGGTMSPPSGGAIAEGKTPRAHKKPQEAVEEAVEDAADPNRNTQQPEDARILSVAFSPRFASDRTAYATGIAPCESRLCPSVLFRSTDGGASWERQPAAGLVADAILLPPGYGQGDGRVFAMGAEGLQVSEDGGASFHHASPAGGPQAAGPMAMSPGFNAGDPSILIGGRTLMRYRDDLKTIEPVGTSAPPGPVEPAYSPNFMNDRTTFLGAISLDPAWGTVGATIYRCVEAVCTSASLEGQEFIPKIRLARDFAETARVHAFTQGGVFVSENGGESFEPLPAGWTDEVLWELLVDEGGRLVAATIPKGPDGHAGLYLSSDGGRSWSPAQSDLFARGAVSIGASGTLIIAGLGERGVACSADGGRTWAARCPVAEGG